jgi:hypothetical protein
VHRSDVSAKGRARRSTFALAFRKESGRRGVCTILLCRWWVRTGGPSGMSIGRIPVRRGSSSDFKVDSPVAGHDVSIRPSGLLS